MHRIPLIAAAVVLLAGVSSAQYLFEDFESGVVPPAGWTENNNGNDLGWEPDPLHSLNGLASAFHDDYTGYNLNSLDSPAADLTGSSSAQLNWDQDNYYPTWTLRCSVLVNGTEVWFIDNYGAGYVTHQVVDLSAYDGNSSVSVSFLYEGDYANEWSLDDITIQDPPPPPPPSHSIFFEDFESGMVPPAGWTENNNGNSAGWELDPFHTLNGFSSAWHDDYTGYNLNGLASPTVDCSGETGVYLEWMQDNVYATWTLRCWVEVNGNEEWYIDSSSSGGVRQESVDLSAYDGNSAVKIEYIFEGDYANEWSLDDIDVRAADAVGFMLSVANLVAGSTTTLSVANAGPGATCIIAYSVYGGGPTNTPVGSVDLTPPIRQLPAIQADSAGAASISASVPPHVGGMNVWIQAVDLGGPELSNSLAETVG
jgi:hypothetical protein